MSVDTNWCQYLVSQIGLSGIQMSDGHVVWKSGFLCAVPFGQLADTIRQVTLEP